MYHAASTLEHDDRRGQLMQALAEARPDQILLRTLVGAGWSIPYLCDLVTSDDFLRLDPRVQVELTMILKPEWVMARRAERASMAQAQAALLQAHSTTALAQEITALKMTIEKMTEMITRSSQAPASNQPPVRPQASKPAAGVAKGSTGPR